MKRYLLFSGVDYYPEGGISDYVNSYDSYDEALKEAKKLLSKGNQWWQIVDTMRGVIKFSDGHTSKFLVSF